MHHNLRYAGTLLSCDASATRRLSFHASCDDVSVSRAVIAVLDFCLWGKVPLASIGQGTNSSCGDVSCSQAQPKPPYSAGLTLAPQREPPPIAATIYVPQWQHDVTYVQIWPRWRDNRQCVFNAVCTKTRNGVLYSIEWSAQKLATYSFRHLDRRHAASHGPPGSHKRNCAAIKELLYWHSWATKILVWNSAPNFLTQSANLSLHELASICLTASHRC